MSTQENALAAKLGGAKISAEELERRLAAADQKIAGASLGFTDWAGADVAEALGAVDKLTEKGENEEHTNVIFRVAHDLKGQGTTFGYPLVTQIGGLLCDFVRLCKPSMTNDMVSVIRAHLSAMNLVLKQNLKGDGDVATQQLVQKLAMAAERVTPKP